LNHILVNPSMTPISLPPTPPLIPARLPLPGLDRAPQLQHDAPGAEDELDSSDDDTVNGAVEDMPPEGDVAVIAELDRATVTLGDDTDDESDEFTEN
jgi:hypothetical protein